MKTFVILNKQNMFVKKGEKRVSQMKNCEPKKMWLVLDVSIENYCLQLVRFEMNTIFNFLGSS